MNGKAIGISIIAALAGLTGGFLVANGLNRSEINTLKLQLGNSSGSVAATATDPKATPDVTLDPEEIKAKISEADAAPSNFDFQKNLGGALYRYAAMKKDTALLEEAARILTRANQLKADDYSVLVDLGNSLFDIGYFKKDPASMKRSREVYEKALVIKSADADVRSDLALAYYLDEPADLGKAVTEFQRAIKDNPKQERALQYLAQTYIRQSDFVNAQKIVDQLRSVNPQNDSLTILVSQIERREADPVVQ